MSRTVVAVALAIAVVLQTTALAHAEPGSDTRSIALPRSTVVLRLGPAWHEVAADRRVGLVAGHTTDAGAVLAVTRAAVPNPAAWRTATRTAYLEAIEQGIARQVAGYRRTARTIGEVHGVPVLDITATRDTNKTLMIRVLAFRTYALALAIELPEGASLDDARSIVQAFQP